MAYSFVDSKTAFEHIRLLLLKAPNKQMAAQVIVDDTTLGGIIPTEEGREEFLMSRNGKEWRLLEDPKLAGHFAITGTAAGDGSITVAFATETHSINPTAADDETAVCNALITEINGNSTEWTASLLGSDTVRVLPLTPRATAEQFTAISGDSGITITAKSPAELPLDILLAGDVKLISESIMFSGSASRA